MKMMKEKDPSALQVLRVTRKKILKTMRKELKLIREKEIDEIANAIENAKDDARMFKAAKMSTNKHFRK